MLKELSRRANHEEDPQPEILSKVHGDKNHFLAQWKEFVMNLSITTTEVFAPILGSHIILGYDIKFEDIKEVALKIVSYSSQLSKVKTYHYFIEMVSETFTENERKMMQLPGSLCSVDGDEQNKYHWSFKCFGMVMDRIAVNIMVSPLQQVIDSSYDENFHFVTGGYGRELNNWLINDFNDAGKPAGHFFHNRFDITGQIVQGLGLLVKDKSTLNLVGYATYTINSTINIELDVCEVLKPYRRGGVATLILTYIATKLHPNISVITGSPTEESFPKFLKSPRCQFQFDTKWGYKRGQRMFISMKPIAEPRLSCPDGFAVKIDEESKYYPVIPKSLDEDEEFTLFDVNEEQRIHDIYSLEAPILIAQDKDRNYRKRPVKLSLFYYGASIAEKEFRYEYSGDRPNDENCIFLAGTCIWIGYLYGALGEKVTEILDELHPSPKRQRLE